MTEFKMLFVRLRFHFAFVLPTVSSVSPPSNPSECRDCANPSVRNLFVRWCGMVIGFSSLWLPGAASIAGPITAWNSEFLNAARLTSGLLVSGAPEVAREMAIVDSAMFDAANAASGLVYKPVAYTGGAALGVSVDAAALAAGYVSMQAIFGNSIWAGAGGSPAVQSTILANIQAAYDAGLSSLGIGGIACAGDGGPTFLCDGLTLGTAAANANLIARGYTVGDHASLAADGSAAAIVKGLLTYTPPGSGTVPGVYVPPSAFGGRPAMFPEWGTVTPFALTAGQLASIVAAAPGPPSITSATYAEGVFRSECQGSGTSLPASIASVCAAAGIAPQTTTQAAAALFWNDPGVTAPGRWLDIVDILAQAKGLSTLETARLAALVSRAEADAGIAAWAAKYQNNLWQPITGIRDCSGWNSSFTTCDPTWTPLVATPPYPDYVAANAAFGDAAAIVLGKFFGTDLIRFSSTSDAYCNGGTTWRSQTTHLVAGCTVDGFSPFAFDGGNTFYGTAATCMDAGGAIGTSGGLKTCTLILGGNPVPFTFSPRQSLTGCNRIVSGGTNDSPLICPITEDFDSFVDALYGFNGSRLGDIFGGIASPFAADDGASLGRQIGLAIDVADTRGVPEPPSLFLLAIAILGLATFRVGYLGLPQERSVRRS